MKSKPGNPNVGQPKAKSNPENMAKRKCFIGGIYKLNYYSTRKEIRPLCGLRFTNFDC